MRSFSEHDNMSVDDTGQAQTDAVDNITLHRYPSENCWYQSQIADLTVTGLQVKPPSFLPLSTLRRSIRSVADGNVTKPTVTKQQPANAVTWHLATDRRLSVDHSKLVLVPTELSRNPTGDSFKFNCSCGRHGHDRRTEQKCCPRQYTKTQTADDLRLDDEKRGRFHTVLLGAGLSSLGKTPVSPQPPQPPARSESIKLRSRRSVVGIVAGEEESLLNEIPRRRQSTSFSTSSKRLSVPSNTTSAASTSAPKLVSCVECETLVAKRFGDVSRMMAFIRSQTTPADLVWQVVWHYTDIWWTYRLTCRCWAVGRLFYCRILVKLSCSKSLLLGFSSRNLLKIKCWCRFVSKNNDSLLSDPEMSSSDRNWKN